MTIKIKKVYIILGIGGSRKDFLTGWLGTLPNFINTRWFVDLATGVSVSDVSFIKEIDALPELTLKDMLARKNIFFDNDDSNLNIAVGFHGLSIENSLRDLDDSQYEIINIDVNPEMMERIFWEQFVKNFLKYNRTLQDLEDNDLLNKYILTYVHPVENPFELTNEEQIEIIKNLYPKFNTNDTGWEEKMKSMIHWCKQLDKIKTMHRVNYNDLFTPGGSKTLCDTIGFTVPEVNHRFWDAMIPFAESPTEIDFIGHIWKKSDHIE
jgi:hypothetical protein